MIRVSIELVPHGDEKRARELHTLTISNIGGRPERGEYEVELFRPDGESAGLAVVSNWPRLERDALALVHAALRALRHGGGE